MSRVGKKIIPLADKVKASFSHNILTVENGKDHLEIIISSNLKLTITSNEVEVVPLSLDRQTRALWGMTRALINNAVEGLSKGYSRRLEIEGVGYKSSIQGKNLVLSLGFSHDILYPIPDDVTIHCLKPTEIVISGISKQRVGKVASDIRGYRPPEPYKGKGVRYSNEYIFRKEGKKK
jgi:large subunit ribosomal protein L6